MRIIVVYGPPCAGKTTYVREHARRRDVVIDADVLAHALGYPHRYLVWPTDGHPAREVMLRARASAIRAARELRDDAATCWLVESHDLDVPGGEVVRLDPGAEVCHHRATVDRREAETHAQIDEWYEWDETALSSRAW